MKLSALLTLVILLFTLNTYAKDEWTFVKTPNFNLVGNASEKDIRKVGTRLEQFRAAFQKIFTKVEISQPIDTNVIVFKNKKSYKPFLPKKENGKPDTGIAGYFKGGNDQNFITLSMDGRDSETYHTIFHEYTHFIVDSHFGKSRIPPWFNEGLAEYYSTLKVEKNQKVKLGLVIDGRLSVLARNSLIPFEDFFAISNRALHANGGNTRSIFYAQAWALIHYLMQSGKSVELSRFLVYVLDGTDPKDAFMKAFGEDYKTMEKELRNYVRQRRFYGTFVELREPLNVESGFSSKKISEADSNAYLGDLLYHMHEKEDAEKYLTASLAADPNNLRANVAMGLLRVSQERKDEARKYLEIAVKNNAQNYFALYNYAFVISQESVNQSGRVSRYPEEHLAIMRSSLKKAIDLNPAFIESYNLLSFVNLVSAGSLDETISILKKAEAMQPANQEIKLKMAQIYLRSSKYDEAKAIASKILATTRDEDLRFNATQIIDQVNEVDQAVKSALGATENSQADSISARLKLLKRQESSYELSDEELKDMQRISHNRWVQNNFPPIKTGEQRVLAKLGKVTCKDGMINYAVKINGKRSVFQSRDFESLEILNFITNGDEMTVGCDVTFDYKPVVLYYKKKAKSRKGTLSEITAVMFVPDEFYIMTDEELKK